MVTSTNSAMAPMNLRKRMLPAHRREDIRFIEEHVQSMSVPYRLVYATGSMVDVPLPEMITEVLSGLRQIADPIGRIAHQAAARRRWNDARRTAQRIQRDIAVAGALGNLRQQIVSFNILGMFGQQGFDHASGLCRLAGDHFAFGQSERSPDQIAAQRQCVVI